mmetsp:Transcript_54400/g.65483  ORF Transcript_54400/g.65483 Transcript_54400/m.65483 type:complete len:87 (-) Transcript_54400:215-475(-)
MVVIVFLFFQTHDLQFIWQQAIIYVMEFISIPSANAPLSQLLLFLLNQTHEVTINSAAKDNTLSWNFHLFPQPMLHISTVDFVCFG